MTRRTFLATLAEAFTLALVVGAIVAAYVVAAAGASPALSEPRLYCAPSYPVCQIERDRLP